VSVTDVIAGALAAACGDGDVLARLGGPLGDAVRSAAAAPADRATRAGRAAAARAPVPAGIRGVHPSWIEAGLAGLPDRARAAVASGGGDAVDTWLARRATAAIPPMPAITALRVTTIDSATRVDAGALEHWLADAGADQLALALSVAGGDALAAAAARIGDRLRAAAARIALAPRAGSLGPVRAAIERCRGVRNGHPELAASALVQIGARAIGIYIDVVARAQIMHRLPRPLGLVVGDALAAAAHGTLGDAPRWSALVAG
jgi:hypothetical protein